MRSFVNEGLQNGCLLLWIDYEAVPVFSDEYCVMCIVNYQDVIRDVVKIIGK